MASFMIGSFAFTATASNKYVAKQVTDSARMIGEYNSNVSKAFAELDKLAIERKNKFLGGKIVKVKGTSIMTLKMPSAQAHNEAMRTLREKEEMQNWMMNWSSSDEVIQKIVVPTSEATLEDSSLKEQQTVKHLRSVKRTRVVKPLRRAVTHPLENLLNALGNICKKRLIAVEIIGKGKPVKTRYVRRNDCTYIKVATKHERGIKRKRDVDISAWSRALLKTLIHKTHGAKKHHTSSFDRGSSGLALLNSVLSGPRSAGRGGVFVVRGKCGDKLYDSQSIVTMGTTNEMIHYSVSDRFWKGYNQGFQDHKPVVNHKCESNLDVEECGVVAAIATQALFPCGRITCEQCIEQFLKEGKDELRDQHSGTLSKLIGEVQVKHPKFLHVVKFLSLFNDFLNFRNDNIAHYAETNRIIGERKETPFKQLSELNDLLIKIGECTNEEVRQGTTRILELSRFQRNRTDNIASGSLSHFRNKVSSKVHVNLDLMCDNQLDDDGNFKWRQRAYHAKRLISNFFELVDPEKGYDAYVHRINPNGVRKTAIGKLIVSTNMQTFRKQMRGEPIESMPLSNSCVSRLKGGFVYPCCCVTTDEGQPIESGMLIPTKNHLVIGNTGDSKFVTMPKLVDEGMYIAKPGYCYVNIFIAMLINISDAQAKDYTKKVRDYVIPELGEWPTLLDVATMCKFLTVFFPDTEAAELPRILVDHKSQIMHVVDSFGSLTTGYHILKANTVGQLIKFANDDLQSELMHYRVGGTLDDYSQESSEDAAVIVLARGVYRPKELKRVLEKDPLLLLYGLLSPCVLVAMYTSKTLETAIQDWLHKDTSVASICNALEVLARKVSCSRVLATQQQIISDGAGGLANCIARSTASSPSRKYVQFMLARMVEEKFASKELVFSGFTKLSIEGDEMREKKFLEVLAHSWRDLSWLERCTAIWRSRKSSQQDSSVHPEVESAGSKETLRERFTYLRGTITRKAHSMVSTCSATVKRKTYEACGKLICKSALAFQFLCPDLFKLVNVLSVFYLLMRILNAVYMHVQEHQRLQIEKQALEEEAQFEKLVRVYQAFNIISEKQPLKEGDFEQHLATTDKQLHKLYRSLMYASEETTEFQAKGTCETELERVIAFIALTLMMFDAERSDCVYKVLCKLKGLMGTVSTETTAFQGVEDINELLGETRMAIDIELDTENFQLNRMGGLTFGSWWENQINQGRTIPHYRTEGQFIEFTRANAVITAQTIAHMECKDILVMGAVGSGKSTSLPFHLSKKGKVLVVEPTRPLAENVHRQLRGAPFNTQATLRIRGCSSFGSAPITVMTSGYALHFYAHNIEQLREYAFIMFDECHVHDSSAIAFRCLLSEYDFEGKVLKVSATPPGREAVYSTQHPVQIKAEESLTFQQFVQMQGTGANGDVIQHGDNILVYVASYNEVDTLSKLLLDQGHKVSKVDGRTMKAGQVEIPTSGTRDKRHFIVATNIIENGVTLDIDVVVDFGMKVVPDLDVDNRLIKYNKVPISYGERIQRLGRVGRNKEGTALRIGITEKGLSAIPGIIATEAAFYCFAYGLPVMTSGVTVGSIANCTVPQARTMLHFELPIFYTQHLVRFDGTMHPVIHNCVKDFKLRDSEILLNRLAIPNSGVKRWMTAGEYARCGAKNSIDDFVRIPFFSKDIPDRVHNKVWEAVVTYKQDAGFGRIQSASACKVAYTLQTDAASITRTVCIIEELIKNEKKKQEYFQAASGVDCASGFSLVSLTNAIRSRHMSNHTSENIAVLEAAKNQLYEFRNLGIEPTSKTVMDFGALECVQFQSLEGVSKQLGLRGHWNKSLITKDVIVAGCTLFGGIWMIYNYFIKATKTLVSFQGSGKRQSQKRRFQLVRNKKHAYEVNPDETDVEYYFGEAYGKKAQGKGRTRGMGTKTRRFYNMYGFDPSEYTFARYVDPLTGYTLDENSLTDMQLVQEHFSKIRLDLLANDELDSAALNYHTNVEAYFVKDLAKQVLRVDLEPHNPLEVGRNTESIAGFPDKKGVLRQVGTPKLVASSLLPKQNEYNTEGASFESKATFQGLRDYNSIASSICMLENDSEGYTMKIHGIGFGSLIITNQHLFKRNNGSLKIRSHRGEFLVPNTTQLKMFPFEGRDLLLIQMPKDFPPFPQKLKFRNPISGERVCLVGSNFQEKYISSTVSEASIIAQKDNSHFYRHWITTQKGHCGLPLVSVKDGYILGIHSLTSLEDASSFFISFPPGMTEEYLQASDNIAWTKKWRLNLDLINWGSIKIAEDKPDKLFKLSKDIFSILDESVDFQSHESGWLYNRLEGNLTAVARTTSQLVTKHVVNGKCLLFATYLETHPDAEAFFKPLMGAYQKSRLNKEAYIKDLFKYNKETVVGVLDPLKFEIAEGRVHQLFRDIGFEQCEYVNHQESIFSALNMKAAVGALYQGKKKDYFAHFSEEDKAQIIKDSCCRLFTGKMGVWNGSLKAELRPLEKVLANKTRTFTAAPIDTLLGGKVCVDDFNNQFYSLNLKGPWSVGMTKFYGGWNELMESLPEGWVYCDADGSQFDSSLTPYLINAVLNLRLQFMEEWDIGQVMLENLYTEIVYTPIATPDGTIIKKFKGNNSGQPSTVVDNTIMVILAMYYSGEVYDSAKKLETYCKFFVNGDDLLIAVHPEHCSFLDKLQESFSHLGLQYSFDSRWKRREDLWFMSHKAIQCEGIYIPKLEEERIVSILEWDRANLPEHRLEALCASMIEAWGYPELLRQIRLFYYWVLDQAPYNTLSAEGKAPYISEVALKRLYTNKSERSELERYVMALDLDVGISGDELVEFQADETLNAGKGKGTSETPKQPEQQRDVVRANKDKDVDVGTQGTYQVPRLQNIGTKFTLPKVRGKTIVNLNHLLAYEPDQLDLSNTRATHNQFGSWYNSVRDAYQVTEDEMGVLMNGLMVWCIENGTSPNINGHWTMMDGETQVEYPLRPIVENAQPTLRQIMAHFSALAEAYIEKRNATKPYMPRYGLIRNLRDMSLARFAFDFYEITSRTPPRAREAHMQMKAAAIRNSDTRMFGLDGNAGDKEENTERHTANDVNRDMHHLMGVRM